MFKKRIIPVFLCLFLLVPLINYKEYESYAMDVVITPFVAKCVLTGLVACGVGIASNADADLIVNEVWSDMSSDLKKSIMAMSSLKEGIEAVVSMWTSSMWTDFKSMVNNFFSSDGGFVTSQILGSSLSMPVVESYSYANNNTDGYITLPGYSCVEYKISDASSTRKYVDYLFYPAPLFSNTSYRQSFEVVSGAAFILPYVVISNNTIVYSYFRNSHRNILALNSYYEISGDSNFSYLVFEGHRIASFPLGTTLGVMVYNYLTGLSVGSALPYDREVPYVVNNIYYPSATGSICPDVPVNKVLSLPLVNDVAVVTAADVVGSAIFTDVGSLDLPVDVPIVPPVDVPIVPPVDVPINTLDFTPLFALNIKNVFPFCIPFDLIKMVKIYSASPVEPNIGVHINNNLIKINHDIDLSLINFPLKFFRFSCIFTFIWILISNTKKLMKW